MYVVWFCDRFSIIVSPMSTVIGRCNPMAGYVGILQTCVNVCEMKSIIVEQGEQWTHILLPRLSSGTIEENDVILRVSWYHDRYSKRLFPRLRATVVTDLEDCVDQISDSKLLRKASLMSKSRFEHIPYLNYVCLKMAQSWVNTGWEIQSCDRKDSSTEVWHTARHAGPFTLNQSTEPVSVTICITLVDSCSSIQGILRNL